MIIVRNLCIGLLALNILLVLELGVLVGVATPTILSAKREIDGLNLAEIRGQIDTLFTDVNKLVARIEEIAPRLEDKIEKLWNVGYQELVRVTGNAAHSPGNATNSLASAGETILTPLLRQALRELSGDLRDLVSHAFGKT